MGGYLCGAWGTVGGLAGRRSHLATAANPAIAGNATVERVYDTEVRAYAKELSKFRQREKEIAELLTNAGIRIKRDAIRGCGGARAFGATRGSRGAVRRNLRKDGSRWVEKAVNNTKPTENANATTGGRARTVGGRRTTGAPPAGKTRPETMPGLRMYLRPKGLRQGEAKDTIVR